MNWSSHACKPWSRATDPTPKALSTSERPCKRYAVWKLSIQAMLGASAYGQSPSGRCRAIVVCAASRTASAELLVPSRENHLDQAPETHKIRVENKSDSGST